MDSRVKTLVAFSEDSSYELLQEGPIGIKVGLKEAIKQLLLYSKEHHKTLGDEEHREFVTTVAFMHIACRAADNLLTVVDRLPPRVKKLITELALEEAAIQRQRVELEQARTAAS